MSTGWHPDLEGDEQAETSGRGNLHASQPTPRSSARVPANQGRHRHGLQARLRGQVRQGNAFKLFRLYVKEIFFHYKKFDFANVTSLKPWSIETLVVLDHLSHLAIIQIKANPV